MKVLSLLLPLLVVSVIKADESVNNYIRAILQNLKSGMKTGIPDLKIPVLEPLSVPTINEHIKEGVADVNIFVDKLQVNELSTFETRTVDADLQNLRLKLGLFIPQVSASATYDLNGKLLGIIPLYGKGPAHVNVNDLVIDASCSLTITAEGFLKANELAIDLKFGSIFANLENILGGGSLGQVVNGVVNFLGKKIFDKFQPDIMREMNKAIHGELNKALSKVKLSDIQGGLIPSGYVLDQATYAAGNANQFLDQILSNARPSIDKDLDPINLPEGKESFSKKLLFVTVHGEVKVFEGWLAGLSTLHRSGDAEMSNSPDGAIIVKAKLALNNLQGHYRAHAKFMNIGPSTEATLSVSYVSVRIAVKQAFTPNAHPELLDFAIERIDKVHVKVGGLGPLNFILGAVADLVGNLVKGAIVKAIQQPLRSLLAQKLSEITIPVGY